MTRRNSELILCLCTGLLAGWLISKLPPGYTMAAALGLLFLAGVLVGMLVENERLRRILSSMEDKRP